MATVVPQTCTVAQLFFRFWSGVGQVSDRVCPITQTPHYRFAFGMLTGTGIGNRGLPEHTGYGRYARWEQRCFGGNTGHDEYAFRNNILAWQRDFDLAQNPIQVVHFFTMPNGTPLYYIADGAHRAAYAAALIGAGRMPNSIPIVVVQAPVGWPQPVDVGTIDQYAPQYLQM